MANNNLNMDGSFLEILLEVKQATMKQLKVATLAIVRKKDTVNKSLLVTPFPILQTEKEKTITCFYLNDGPDEGDIVLVLFLDRDFIMNLAKVRRQIYNIDTITSERFHAEEYGIAIQTL